MIILLAQSTLLLAPLVEGGNTIPPSQPEETALTLPVAPERSLLEGWAGAADAGLTMIGGNNESAKGSANLTLGWEGALDGIALGAHYSGDRSTDKATGTKTTNSRLYQYDGAYNRFFSEAKEWYAYGNADVRQDSPNGLQSRNGLGVGVGRRFHMFETTEVNLEGGASYVTENKVGTLSDTSGVGRIAYDFTSPLSESMEFTGAGVYLNGGDIETYIQDLGLKWNLNGSWYLQLSVNVAYDANPTAGFGSTDRRYNLVIGTTF